jgi:RimJ/RimL family protein N-acetyltransferase
MTVLETPRLVLRRLTLADAGFVLELLNDPAFVRFVGDRGIRTEEDARTYLANGPLASYERLGFGLNLVSQRTDGAAIGICGLLKRPVLDDVDIGFAYLPRYRAQGLAHEAAAATLAHARDVLKLPRLAAVTAPDNTSSIRLLERLGLRYEKMVQLSPSAPSIRLYARAL